MAIKMKKFKALFLTAAGEIYTNQVGEKPPNESQYYIIDDVYQDISQIFRMRKVGDKYLGQSFIRLELLCDDFISVVADMDKLAKEIEDAVNSDLNYRMN